MSTFGYTTQGSGNAGIAAGNASTHYIIGTAFTCPEDCTGDSITAYFSLSIPGRENPTYKIKCMIYDLESGGAGTHALVATSDEWTFGALNWPGSGWHTFNLSSSPSLTGGHDYLLVAWGQITGSTSTTAFIKIAYNSVGTPYFVLDDNTPYGTPPDPLTASDLADFTCSIYVTYTPTASTPKLLTLLGVGT